jgi:hypothetical protein
MDSSFVKRGGFLTFFSLKKLISVKKEFLFSLNMFFFSYQFRGFSEVVNFIIIIIIIEILKEFIEFV